MSESFDIFAVTIKQIEIHEIAKNQTLQLFAQRGAELFHSVGIIFCGDVMLDAAAVVDVMNLSDAEDQDIFFGENVEQHWAWRLDGIIMTALGALKIPGGTEKRPGDDASHTVRAIGQSP